MADKVRIYGKDACPYTNQAREDYAKRNIEVDYINVLESDDKLKEMLKHSKGDRSVPVIVEDGKVSIGFGGGS
jgi:glutaredoxin